MNIEDSDTPLEFLSGAEAIEANVRAPEEDFAELVLRELEEAFPNASDAEIMEGCKRMGAIFERFKYRLGGDGLDCLVFRLSTSVAGIALRRILLGPDEVPLRDDAKRLRCSHVAIIRAEKRLRKLLRLPDAGSLVEAWIAEPPENSVNT
jgi:hypothetical protein